jgi:hypothetical protein
MAVNNQIPVVWLVIVGRFNPTTEESVTISTKVYANRQSAYACKSDLEKLYDGKFEFVNVTRRHVNYDGYTPVFEARDVAR